MTRGIMPAASGPYIIEEVATVMGSIWIATDPATGIGAAGPDRENAEHIATALNTERQRTADLLAECAKALVPFAEWITNHSSTHPLTFIRPEEWKAAATALAAIRKAKP